MRFRPFLIIFVLFFSFSVYAQDWTLPFTSHIEKDGKTLQGAVITLMQGSTQVATTITGNDGGFKLEIPPNGDFTLIVTKPGHCVKKFTISTRGVPADKTKGAFKGFDIESISLFEPLPGIDYSVLNQPLVKVSYMASKDNFDYDEAYSNQMLSALDRLRALEAAALAKQRELEASYKAAIVAGDKAFLKKDWANAKASYGQAANLKPAENYPKDQLKQIDKIIADAEALNKKAAEEAKKAAEEAAKKKAEEDLNNKYLAALKKGDDAFAKKDWPTAKAGYTEALGVKPAEQLPKDKLALVDKAIADAAKADADAKAKAELEAKYAAAIKRGDDAFAKKDWPTAKAAYTEASGLKSAEQYPKTQLAAIDKAMADEAAAKAKADADAKVKAEAEAKYLAAIKKGDDAFAKKDWTTAKAGFTEATGLKPAEQYPKDKLAAIDKAIADDAAAKAKADADAKAKAELDAKYLAAVKKGDDAFAKKDWVTAKAGYNEALGLKSAEPYPKMQLTAIDKAIADEAAAKAKAEGDAKAKAELEAKYLAAVKKGDDAFATKTWVAAKAAYNEALGLKPSEQYPKTQIAAIDKALADEAAAKAKADADAKAKADAEAKYLAAIKKGDDAFGAKNWTTARVGYNEAVSLKPGEKYPKDQLALIEKAIADERANMDAAAKAKAEAELNAKYAAALKKGDDGFAAKTWTTAKAGYNEALALKPAEKYPKDQLALIEKAIADEKANMDAAAKAKAEAELNAKYAAAIKKGDDAFAAKSYPAAKAAYNEALALKSGEKYPKDQLAAIDALLGDAASAKAKAEAEAKAKAELEAKYAAAIKKADGAFGKKDWTNARAGYNEALSIKSEEQYPKDKLAAIDKAIEDEKGKMDAAAKAKAEAELNAKYAAVIKKADDAFSKKQWPAAKAAYNEALGIKHAEQYPKDQIAAINKAIADENKAKIPVVSETDLKYQAAIKRGDEDFKIKQYKEAKKDYEEALTYKGGDPYAKGKLVEIEKLLNSDAGMSSDERLKALLAKYPPGVTEETITGNSVTIIQRVVVKDNMAWVYQKKIFSWGGSAYFRDSTPITELTFENETRP